jgi:dephospho-CoA kinase
MIIIGLTGGIAMGKSTVAAIFRRHNILVFDADLEVRRLQAPNGVALRPIAQAFPDVVKANRLDRAALRARVLADPDALKRLEAIMHPLVRRSEQRFIAAARRRHARAILLDIPLLFETGGERRMDLTITVSAPPAIQLARARRRRAMSEPQIRAIIAKQMPDWQKRQRADRVIFTGLSRHHTQVQANRLIRDVQQSQQRPAHWCEADDAMLLKNPS